MTYEYSLRRLFRDPIDHLPPSEQLQYYNQRSLAHSHVYRLGTGLFRGHAPTLRRRCIDAAHFTPAPRTPHPSHVRAKQQPKQTGSTEQNGTNVTQEAACSTHDHQTPLYWFRMKSGAEVGSNERLHTAPPSPSTDDQSDEVQYKKWLSHRRELRGKLDDLGANRGWLLSKDCTPLEKKLLTTLNKKQPTSMTGENDVELPEVSTAEVISPVSLTQGQPSHKKKQLSYRMQMLKEINLMEKCFAKYRFRLVQLLSSADRKRNCTISVSDMLGVINKLKIPLSQAAIELLLRVLVIDDNGHLDYKQLLNGEVLRLVDTYFQRESISSNDSTDSKKDHEIFSSTSEAELAHLNKPMVSSTLDKEKGTLADAYKKEELRQFKALVDYCKKNEMVLDWHLAERALLLPQDHTKSKCKAELRQPGLTLLSRHFADLPDIEDKKEEVKLIYEGFGKRYRELRGPKRAKYMKLSTGGARVRSKTDCWLTFKEYQRLTEHIRSRPGFKYKDHGLPDNNAFWPGALLDKLRLWMPDASLNKSSSVDNIFQPVTRTKFSNPLGPVVEQVSYWPENRSGYVQFGSQNRKQYTI